MSFSALLALLVVAQRPDESLNLKSFRAFGWIEYEQFVVDVGIEIPMMKICRVLRMSLSLFVGDDQAARNGLLSFAHPELDVDRPGSPRQLLADLLVEQERLESHATAIDLVRNEAKRVVGEID